MLTQIQSGVSLPPAAASGTHPLPFANTVIHFPRRFTFTISILFRRRARRNSFSCVRSRPERISQPLRLSFGKSLINNPLNRFAVTISRLRGSFQCRRSANSTRRAPKRFAARARMPLPVPRSASDQPLFHSRVNCSSSRSDIAVVACSPVPNAVEAGITRSGGFPTSEVIWESPCFEISNRFPSLSGLVLETRVNRFSQSRGNFSARPPNSSTNLRESFRDLHVISSCNRLRPGFEMIASWPRERACKMLSRALSQASRVLVELVLSTAEGASRRNRLSTECSLGSSAAFRKVRESVTLSPDTRDACATPDSGSIYFLSGAFSPFICAIFCARPAAYFSYWTLSIVKVPSI